MTILIFDIQAIQRRKFKAEMLAVINGMTGQDHINFKEVDILSAAADLRSATGERIGL